MNSNVSVRSDIDQCQGGTQTVGWPIEEPNPVPAISIATGIGSQPPWLHKPRLRRKEASKYLLAVHGVQMAPSTLAKLATIGGGPEYQKFSRWPLYTPASLDNWVRDRISRPFTSTSDADFDKRK